MEVPGASEGDGQCVCAIEPVRLGIRRVRQTTDGRVDLDAMEAMIYDTTKKAHHVPLSLQIYGRSRLYWGISFVHSSLTASQYSAHRLGLKMQ